MVKSQRRSRRAGVAGARLAGALLVAGATVAAITAARPSRTRACSCVPPVLSRTLVPASGARGVPTDARIRVFLTGGFPASLRRQLGREYRLRDVRGNLVKLRARVVVRRLDLIPVKPLGPNQIHTLEQLVAYDGHGTRLSDDQHWHLVLARQSPNAWKRVRRAWFPVATFTTGSVKGPTTVHAPRVTSAGLSFAYGGGDCGPGIGLQLRFRLFGTRASDALELEVKGQGVVSTSLPESPRRGVRSTYVSDMICNPDKVFLRYGGRLAARLWIRSASGHRSKATGWTVARGTLSFGYTPALLRARRHAAWRWRRAAATYFAAAVQRWAASPVLGRPQPAVTSPAACPHGFEAMRRGQVAKSGAPWMYDEISSLGWTGNRGYLVLRGGKKKPSRLVSFDDKLKPRMVKLPLSGSEPAVHVTAQGIFVAMIRYGKPTRRSAHSVILVVRLTAAGRVLWQRDLATGLPGTHWHPRILAGGGRVLVTWSHTAPGYLKTGLVWRLLEPGNGNIVAQSKPMGRPHSQGYPGLAYVAGRFLLAHHTRRGIHAGPAHLWLISKTGADLGYRRLGLGRTGGGLDLAPLGKGAALVVARRGQIIWAWVDAKGRLTRGPEVVSHGQGTGNRKPRIARRGQLYAVAWETHLAGNTHVTAVGPRGRAAPVLHLARDRRSSTVGVAATRTGFVASVTRRMATTDAWLLTCRKRPPTAPPALIKRTW